MDICRTDDGARAKCVQRMLVGHNVFVADPHAPVPGTGAHGVMLVHEREALSDLMPAQQQPPCLVELSETNHPLDNACGARSVSGAASEDGEADYDTCVHDLGGHWEVKDPRRTTRATTSSRRTATWAAASRASRRRRWCRRRRPRRSARRPRARGPPSRSPPRAAWTSSCSRRVELDVSEARCRAFKDLIKIDVAAAAGVRLERVVDLQCHAPLRLPRRGGGRRRRRVPAGSAPAAPQSAWACDASVNYVPGMAYTQHTIDSMYSAGQTTFDDALERCGACEAWSSCSGFFYQQHVTTQ